MNGSSYEEYKKNLSRSQKRHSALHDGKIQLVLGICFILYLLYVLPFHAGDLGRIHGDELKAGNAYGREFTPVKVFYADELHILRAKPDDTDDGQIYCIAKFFDCDQNEWILSFTPGKNKRLAERIRLADTFEGEFDLTVSGYLRMESLEDLPFEADSFLTVYGRKYADADVSNLLSLNADYLCDLDENYMQAVLFRPGYPLGSLIAGLVSTVWGISRLVRYRKQK